MEITKILYIHERKEWRAWLKKHYQTTPEIWLQYYKKDSGKPRISYNDAVEEALCFGWIDSIVKKLNKESFVQRFSPRKPKSPYSQMNKERLKKLIKEDKVAKEVLPTVEGIPSEMFEIPKDILTAIKTNKEAWKNFQKFSAQYQRIRIAFIDGARKRPGEFEKRLNYFIIMTTKNKQFGFGGIEEYFK